MAAISDPQAERSKFLSPENFRLAWRRVLTSDRLEVKDRLGLKVFETNIDLHLELLANEIEQGKYSAQRAEVIYVPKKSRTLRPFPFLSIRDQIVYQAIGNIIIENSYKDILRFADTTVFAHIPQQPDSDFVLLSAKSRNGKIGQYEKFKNAIIENRKNFQDINGSTVVKTDIAAFYPSIDHSILSEIITNNKWLNHPDTLSLLIRCLGIWSANSEFHFKQGVPIGYATSDILATLFLLDVDKAMLHHCYMLRYVDDMYLFAPRKSKATRAVIELDRLMQNRGLVLQTSKTDFDELSNSEADDEYREELELQERLSIISTDLEGGSPEDVEFAQSDLFNLFTELWDPDPKEYLKYESKLAFILYRLTVKDDSVRDAAISMLDNAPLRSVHATKYLSNFVGDNIAINRLLEFITDADGYAQVRANCLRMLSQIWSNKAQVRSIAKIWCKDPDWHLRLTGIDMLQKSRQDFPFIREIAVRESNRTVRAAALAASFGLTDRLEEKIDIIKQCLRDDDYLIRHLGIYLWQRESSLSWDDLGIDDIDESMDLFLDASENAQGNSDASDLRQLIKRLCDFEISLRLPISDVFQNVDEAKQFLKDAYQHRETAPNIFLRSFVGFCQTISRTVDPDAQIFPDNLFSRVSFRVSDSMGRLIAASKRLPESDNNASVMSGTNAPVIKVPEVNRLIKDVSTALALIFADLHSKHHVEMPDSLKRVVLLQEPVSIEEGHIFISYKREDCNVAFRVRDGLNKAGISTWLDQDDIERDSGIRNNWTDGASQGLKSSWGMVVIVTPEAMASENVEDEWSFAKEKGLLLIPFLVRTCEIPFRMGRKQRIDATDDLDAAIEKLIESIKKRQPNSSN